MSKPRLFVSHLSKETELAQLLKKFLVQDFLGFLDVFASSDGKSIELGSPWLDEVQAALAEARFAIVLCSKESIDRPWVNFEVGAAWIREIPVMPICHSGLTPPNLPIPLKMFQAIEAGDANGLRSLYDTLAKRLEMNAPAVDFTQRAAEIKAIEAAYIERERARNEIVNPRILCAASEHYAEPAFGFDLDVEVLEKAFPGRVVVERKLTSKSLRDLLTRQRFDIIHLVLAVDPNNGDMFFSRTDPDTHQPVTGRRDKMSATGFADLVETAGAHLVVLNTCQALFLAARVAAVANMVATHTEITGEDASAWADCFYNLLAQGRSLYNTDEITASNMPDARMVLIRHKDVAFALHEPAGS